MLHIKDIEAFARINEALAGNGTAAGGLFGTRTDGPGTAGPLHPALLFARLATGMMTTRVPSGPTAAPVPAPLPANDAEDDAAVGFEMAMDAASVPPAANDDGDLPGEVSANPGFAHTDLAHTALADTDADDDHGAASVDAIPLARADVLPFPFRRREAQDSSADSIGDMAYDFDLVPHRPVTMVGLLTRMFFGQR